MEFNIRSLIPSINILDNEDPQVTSELASLSKATVCSETNRISDHELVTTVRYGTEVTYLGPTGEPVTTVVPRDLTVTRSVERKGSVARVLVKVSTRSILLKQDDAGSVHPVLGGLMTVHEVVTVPVALLSAEFGTAQSIENARDISLLQTILSSLTTTVTHFNVNESAVEATGGLPAFLDADESPQALSQGLKSVLVYSKTCGADSASGDTHVECFLNSGYDTPGAPLPPLATLLREAATGKLGPLCTVQVDGTTVPLAFTANKVDQE